MNGAWSGFAAVYEGRHQLLNLWCCRLDLLAAVGRSSYGPSTMTCGHSPPEYSTMEQLERQEMGTGTRGET